MPKIPDDLITLSDAGRISNRAYMTVWRWTQTGKLKVYRIGGRPFVRKADATRLKK